MTHRREHSKQFIQAREKLAEEHLLKHMEASQLGNVNRAMGIAIGTSFGGTVEITLRKNDGQSVYAILQPVEAVEIVHQMAASLGCHLQLMPRNDFASWRNWKTDENGQHVYTDHPPMVENFEANQARGIMPPPVHPASMGTSSTDNRSNENVMATKKTVNRRSIKRATKTP